MASLHGNTGKRNAAHGRTSKSDKVVVRLTTAKKRRYISRATQEGTTLSRWIEKALDAELEKPYK